MTIEELSQVATDNENFSREGTVAVRDKSGQVLEVRSASYNLATKQLILEVSEV